MAFQTRFRTLSGIGALLAGLGAVTGVHAFSLTLNSGPPRVFLHVGNGAAYDDNSTVNKVSVDLTGAQLLSGLPQAMTTDSTQSVSLSGSGNTTCPTPDSQIMVGAAYRRPNANAGNALLTASSPGALTNADGESIPFSEIRWTVSASGSPNPGVIPAGSFTGSVQTLATVPANTYIENCHSFSYANSAMRAAGTYTGRVTYTLSSP